MFADKETITSHILDVVNAAPPGTFSNLIDTSHSGDKRRSQEAIESAQVVASRKVIESLADNPSHPYWANLMTMVEHANDVKIKAHYGQIGIPYIMPVDSLNGVEPEFLQGVPKDRDEIEGVLYPFARNPTDYYGFGTDTDGNDSYQATLDAEGRWLPNSYWYSTANGIILFSGHRCKIPMIVIPTDDAEEGEQSDDVVAEMVWVSTHVPVNYIPEVVWYAVGSLLLKEGDNMSQIGAMMLQEAKSSFFEIAGGRISVKPIDPLRAIESRQKYAL